MLPLYEPIEAAVLVAGLLFTVGDEGALKCWNMENAKLLKSSNICGLVFFNDFNQVLILCCIVC